MAGVSQGRVAESVEDKRTGSERAAAAAPESSDAPAAGTTDAKAESYAKHAGRAVTGKFVECAAAAKEYAAQTKDAAIRTAGDAASAIRRRAARFTSSAKETGSQQTQESTTARQETSAVQERAVGPAAAGVKDATLASKGRSASLAAKEYVMETIRGAQTKFGQIFQSVEDRASHGKETAGKTVVPAHKDEEETVGPTVKDRVTASAADVKGRTAEPTANTKNRAVDADIDAKDKITGAAPAKKKGADGTITNRVSEASRMPGAYVESAKGTVAGVVNRIGKKAHQVCDNLSGRTLTETSGGEPLLPKEEATTAKAAPFDPDASLAGVARQQLQLTS